MEIQKTYNTTKEEIESKRFNIFIGISLGNKWFSKENIKEYLKWSLEHTKEKVLVLIADEIQAINYNARNKLEMETALKKALRVGDKVNKIVEQLIFELPKEKREKIIVIRWGALKEDLDRKMFLNELYDNYYKKDIFYERISKIVEGYTSKEKRKFSDITIQKMKEYLIEELPEFLIGILNKKYYYNLYIYPKDSNFFYFVRDIQEGKIHLKLSKKFPKEKISFAIVN